MKIPESGIPKLPTKEQLEEAIKEYETINWDEVNLKQVDSVIPWPLKAMMCPIIEHDSEMYYYRVRPYHSFDSKNFQNDNIFRVKSFSYPPKGTLSRCGTIEKPVFYAASNLEAALIESKSKDTLNFVGCWKLKPEKKMLTRPYISNLPKGEVEHVDEFLSTFNSKLDNLLKQYFSEEQREIFKRLEVFHDQQFTKDGDTSYKYSSWLANKNFNIKETKNNKAPNAIVYQSTIDSRLGTNFAIKPNFVVDSMELKDCYLITLRYNQNTDRYSRILLSVGEPNKPIISWHEPTSLDFEKFKKLHHVPIHAALINS